MPHLRRHQSGRVEIEPQFRGRFAEGQLDQNAVFYLRTRGLTLHEAAQALTRAFATAIVARCPVEQARGWLERAVEARLEELVVADPAGVRPEGEAEPGNRR